MLYHIINIHLGLICLYHFLAGLFTLGPKSWVQSFTKKVYALNIPENYEPRYEATLKFLGLMAWAVSALTLQALIWPDKRLQAFTLTTLAGLFMGRVCLRILLKKTLADAYGLTFKRSLSNIIFNVLLSLFTLTLAVLRF